MARHVERRRRATASTLLPVGAVTNDVGVRDDHASIPPSPSPSPPSTTVGDIVVDRSVSKTDEDGRVVCYRTPDSVVKDKHDVDVVRVDGSGGLWVRCPKPVRHCYTLWTATDAPIDASKTSRDGPLADDVQGSTREPTARVSIDLSHPDDVVAVNMTGVKVLGSGTYQMTPSTYLKFPKTRKICFYRSL